jgi:hypothetical protein
MGVRTEKWQTARKYWKSWDDIVYSILIYVQQDAKLHSLFYLETALNVLGGTTRNM